MSTPVYNRIIRKLVVGFGNLFNNITLVRYNPDNTEAERVLVPIAYAPKERYVMRLEDDYTLDKKVQIALPRFSYEMTGMRYDSSRKQNTNIRNFSATPSGVVAQYNPVPYDFDFSLYLYVRNIEDAHQIVENIIPYFTPDYTIKLNLIPEMGIVKEIPIILDKAEHEIVYEGPREQETRMVIWTFNFTVKGFIYGKQSEAGLIKTSITNIYNQITPDQEVKFTMDLSSGIGTYQIGEIVYQGYSPATATARGKVILFDNNSLHLTQIEGNFVSTQPIYGINTRANYLFTSYNLTPEKLVEINISVDPINANITDPWVANTTITEYN